MDSTEGATTSVRDPAGERKPLRGIALALALGLLILPAAALGQSAPPDNDNYLSSRAFNEPGTRLNSTERLIVERNTSLATIQGDVFSPPNNGGPPEPTTCDGVSYGKTVWFDFFPHVTGLASLRASGFDAVIRVVPFNRQTFAPNFQRSLCSNASSTTTEDYAVEVAKGRSYTVQVGGVNNAGGDLEFELNFFGDPDRDGVVGEQDDCPRLEGAASRDGCPLRLRAESRLRALPTASGIELLSLNVSANRKSRIAVRCRGCPGQVKRGKSARFPRLAGRELPAGSKLEIRVTRKGAFGSYTAFRIVRGNLGKKVTRCMNPGSRKLRRKCG